MKKPVKFTALTLSALAIVVLAGCAGQRETYVVLPDAKGQAGTLTVTPKEGQALKLQGAYASGVGKPGSAPVPTKLTEEEIKAAIISGTALNKSAFKPRSAT